MSRARLYIVLISVCVLSAACAKKAKMRTVPRQTPAPTAGATGVPVAPPAESPEVNPSPAPAPGPETATGPVPAPAAPMTRLDDSDERRVARPAPRPAPQRELRSEDGELNRPRPRPVIVEEDCDTPVQRERVIAPRPAPRPRPVIVERPVVEERIERRQQFELDPADELHCRWEPTGKPMTYMKFDPATKTAWVQHGWPQKWSKYTQVRLVTGLAPYGEEGLSLVSKIGLSIAHLKATGNGTIWYERGNAYPYESYFGQVPGAPQGEAIRGVCWTKSEPAKQTESGGN